MIDANDVANVSVKRVQADKDLVIGISGDEGDGKSALGQQIGAAIGEKSGLGFDVENNMLYSPKTEELDQKIRLLPRYSPIIADEAINILYKLNWQTKGQKYINQLYATCRQENKITMLLIPRFWDLNDYFRNHRVKIWLHIIDPISKEKNVGHAATFVRSWSPFAKDPWWLGDAQKTLDKYAMTHKLKEVDFAKEEKFDALEKSRNFVDIVKFGWSPKPMWDRYIELKEKNKYVGIEPIEGKNKVADRFKEENLKLVAMLTAKGVQQEEIANYLGVNPSTLSVRKTAIKRLY